MNYYQGCHYFQLDLYTKSMMSSDSYIANHMDSQQLVTSTTLVLGVQT